MGNLKLTRKTGEAIRYATPVGSFDVSYQFHQGKGRLSHSHLADDIQVYRTEILKRLDDFEIDDPLGVFAGFSVSLDIYYDVKSGEIPYVEVMKGTAYRREFLGGGETSIKRGDDLARQLTGLIRDDVADAGEKFEQLRDKCRGV